MATRVARSSRTVTTRLEPSKLPPDSSSKKVYSPPPMASGSCCQAKIFPSRSRAWPGAARRAKELCLPPSCHMTWPVRRSTLKTVQVFRELTSRLPSVSRWTALMWNQSQGVLGEDGRGA